MKVNRIAYMVITKIYSVPWMLFNIRKARHAEKYRLDERYAIIRKVITKINKVGKVEIKYTGLENLPKENGYILFPNHQGMFDILLAVETHERQLSIVMRDDLEKIALLKWVKEAVDGKTIDRNDVRQAMKVIKEMSKEVQKGKNFIIFPEGTRSKEGNNPGNFKGGTFKSAVRAKAPIVPVALVDSFKPFDIRDTKKVKVQIHYLKPLYYEDYKNMNTLEIAEIVKKNIIEEIKKNTA